MECCSCRHGCEPKTGAASVDSRRSGSTIFKHAPPCVGKRATIVGTPGSDHLMGTPKAGVIMLGGDDQIDGLGGNDSRSCSEHAH